MSVIGFSSVIRIFALLLVSHLVACSKPVSHEIRFALASAPLNLDPRFATDATSSRINRLLYQRLVDFDEAFQVKPSLANWEKITARHYRFYLKKEGRQFQYGGYLTAEDIKATYDYILDKANASPHRGALAVIDKVQVVDTETVDFLLKKPDPLFPGYLVIGIVAKASIDKGVKHNAIANGSGPFRFIKWSAVGELLLERRRDKQQVRFIHVQDATVRVLKLIRGEIDLLQNDLPRELVHYLRREQGIDVLHRNGNNYTYLGFNLNDSILKNINVRKAIAHALNREALIKHMLGGKTLKANAILTPDHWAGLPQQAGYEFNLDKAKAYLLKAGYTDERPLQLEYKTSSDPFRIRIASVIQQQLAQAGIQVDLKSYEWATFYGDIKSGRFQLYSLSWVGIKSPDIFRYVFHSESIPPKGANRGRYANQEVDKLIELAENSGDLARRSDYYRHIQEILLQQLPYVPLWYEEHFMAKRQGIEGYQLAYDGNYDGLMYVRKQAEQQGAN